MSDHFLGMRVVTDPYCPPERMFILNNDLVVIHRQVRRTRWWWKPWTWRRPKYTPLTLEEMWS